MARNNRCPFPKAKKGTCAHTHTPLDLGGIEIYRGVLSFPIIRDANIYVSLDDKNPSRAAWPWSETTEVLFPIKNYMAPSNPGAFVELVTWSLEQLDAGKKIHAGCYAGHGRTGIYLAALVAQLELDPDPIKFVRKNYCPKAVESIAQIDFLVDVFGCKKAKPREYPKAAKGKLTTWGGLDTDNVLTLTKKTGHGANDHGYGDWLESWKDGQGG